MTIYSDELTPARHPSKKKERRGPSMQGILQFTTTYVPFLIDFVPSVIMLAYYWGFPLELLGFSTGIMILVSIILLRDGRREAATRSLTSIGLLQGTLLCLFPLVVVSVQYAQLYRGMERVDFGLYAQIIHRYVTTGDLESSLLGTEWISFLTHHFSPYLYLLGITARILGNDSAALLFWHALAIFAVLWGSYKILSQQNLSRENCLTALMLCILLPSVRSSLPAEVHDELYAPPLLVWAFYFFLKRRSLAMYSQLILACLVKETMFLSLASHALMWLIKESAADKPRNRFPHWIALACGIFGFLLYTRILPGRLFWPTFNGFARIATVSEFFAYSLLTVKCWWAVNLILPLTPLLISNLSGKIEAKNRLTRFCIYSIPTIPFVGSILITNFPPMLDPSNYYSVIPAISLFLAAIAARENVPLSRSTLILSCTLAAVFGATVNYSGEIRSAIFSGDLSEKVRHFIPLDSVVVVDEYDVQFFAKYRQVIRFFHANRNNVRFDYVVQRKTDRENISLYLRSWSAACYEDENWLVRCAHPTVRPPLLHPAQKNALNAK